MKDGEVVCNKCNGKGYLIKVANNPEILQECPKCRGSRTLNWVENVMGKKFISFDIEEIEF